MEATVVRPSFVCRQHFHCTSLKLLGQCQFNFICNLQAKGEKFYIFGPGHMAKMPAMPIYMVKTLKNLESWNLAFGELVLFSLYN